VLQAQQVQSRERSASVPQGPPVPAGVRVEVMGQVRLVGSPSSLGPGTKELELVTYLAFHAKGVTAEQLWEDLWPGQEIKRSRLNQVITRARHALGSDSQGRKRLPAFESVPHPGRYALLPSVGLDFDLFISLLRYAEGCVPEDRIFWMRKALELVRGQPFQQAGKYYQWTETGLFLNSVTVRVLEGAAQLAGLCLEAGDGVGAMWAATQGLLVVPGNEFLCRLVMRGAYLAGNRAAIEQVMSEIYEELEENAGVDVPEQPETETLELYERLLRTVGVNASDFS